MYQNLTCLQHRDIRILNQWLQRHHNFQRQFCSWHLIGQNPDRNADLIRLLNSSTPGTIGDLDSESVDRNILSNLCADLAILSNILAQSQAANQEIPTDLADGS